LDNDSLGAFLCRLALASAPLITAGCTDYLQNNCPSQPWQEVTVTIASLQDGGAADAGTVDAGLMDLCRLAVPDKSIQRCEEVSSHGQPAVHVVYTDYCLGGRRPAGLADPVPSRTTRLGAWLARMAHLEAASVDAFEILGRELGVHGAPPALVDATRKAADDERRHARLMTRLARAAGARPSPARVTHAAPRALEEVARENAVEGCVHETFAALLAWRQAFAADDRGIRAAMALIAPDESDHAALSLAIDAWAAERLGGAARRRVREAREEASARLVRDVERAELPELRAAAGLPDGDTARALASALFARLT
jgi:hypothetical protein